MCGGLSEGQGPSQGLQSVGYICWWPVASGIPQSSVLGPVLFNHQSGCRTMEYAIRKFSDNTKLGAPVGILQGQKVLQSDLHTLEHQHEI